MKEVRCQLTRPLAALQQAQVNLNPKRLFLMIETRVSAGRETGLSKSRKLDRMHKWAYGRPQSKVNDAALQGSLSIGNSVSFADKVM